ncbi:hypothetical protein SeLEV6574_g08302 [Synchytrium endobioticum]|uniref:Reverse transcriptase domain-containing protein n=1 Tax=Synchytrium endobioticum TaxID=286115 RepID=A0A507BZP3_9FUNG|nr:hypothetical protein SeLEV6574_g08302 [Synchytrium endobioticum]
MPPPKNRPLFRLSKSHRELTEAMEVREGLADGTLTNSQSPFAANLFFIERDGKTRPCIDYRDLNACTIDDIYPMANVKELVQQMAGADWYCKLDLKKAYNQIRVKEGSQPKLAFKCHVGTFQPEVMPFGPKNAPSVMQRYVDDKFGKFIEDGRVVNLLDDFYIRTVGTIPDHQLNIEEILRVMDVEILVLADDKSIWFAKEIPMMGFIVNKYGYRKDMSRLGALLDYGTSSTPIAITLPSFVNPIYQVYQKDSTVSSVYKTKDPNSLGLFQQEKLGTRKTPHKLYSIIGCASMVCP